MTQIDYLKIYLNQLPPFQAIFRAIEAEAITRNNLTEPVLDIGCGDGTFTEAIIKQGKNITGVDLNQNCLEQAAKKGVYQKLEQASVYNLPFANNSFNTVICNSVLEHIKQIDTAIEQIYRVLKKEGTLLFTAPSENRRNYLMDRGFKHHHCWSGSQWETRLKEKGFSSVSYHYLGSSGTTLLSDVLLPFAFLGLLEKTIFNRYLPWRKYSGWLFYQLLKNFDDQVKNNKGTVIFVKAVK